MKENKMTFQNNKCLLFFAWLVILPCFVFGQQKKKIEFSQLDIIKGLFFQPNTIDPYSGTAFEKHSNGKKKMEVPIQKGKIDGKVTEWAPNGKKIFEANYIMGSQTGTEMQWYETGTKKLQVPYTEGLANGVCSEWHKNGKKKSEGTFDDGKEEGLHAWWYNTGEKDQEVNYKKGLTDGTVKQWHQNGRLRLEQEFSAGKKEGKITEWYGNGQKKAIGAFKNDVEEGTFKQWSKNGLLLALQQYESGKIIVDYNYRSGNIKTEKGYVQVFNEKESFFSIKIEGQRETLDRTVNEITYAIDGMLLQMYTLSIDSLSSNSDEVALLNSFVDYEKNYIERQTGKSISIEKKIFDTQNGMTAIKWSFDAPSKLDKEQKPRTVQREYYISMLCNKQILSLYSVVTNSDEPDAPPMLLDRIAKEVKVAKERIDLNAIARNATRP